MANQQAVHVVDDEEDDFGAMHITSKGRRPDVSNSAAGQGGFSGGVAKPGGNKMGSKMAPPADPINHKNLDNLRLAITKLEKMLYSESSDIQLEATKKFRQLLSVNDRDPMGSVQDMLDKNIVPQLLTFLEKNGHAQLQVEALWALTNIAAGTTEHTHLLIKNNAVPTLVVLLDSTNQDVLEQAVWVLGNIAGDGHTARDTVLAAGALEPLLRCMRENKKTSLLRIATWTLSNLCDGQPRPVFKVQQVLHTIREVLQGEDTEVLSHACWALSHLCDGPSPHIQAVVMADVCQRLVALLHCKSWRVVKPALRTVGNIVCAEDDQDYTQQIIECGAVPCLRMLIKHNNREIQKEACWTLSNIAAGTIDQIQCVLDSGSIPTLVELASKNAGTDPDVRIEACWVLLNATSCGSDSQIQFLVNAGCVSVLCTLLDDNSMVLMALEGLEKILQVGEEQNRATLLAASVDPFGLEKLMQAGDERQRSLNAHAAYTPADGFTFIHAGLLDTKKIEALQRHRSSTIAKRASKMWKQHFVVCAICTTAYSKNSTSTKFCLECKCDVCIKCNCGVYHLSYQDALWKDLAEGEAKQQTTKQQSKKSKKKKKKAKDKKRKEQQKHKSDKKDDDSDGDSDDDEDNDNESPQSPTMREAIPGTANAAPLNPPSSLQPVKPAARDSSPGDQEEPMTNLNRQRARDTSQALAQGAQDHESPFNDALGDLASLDVNDPDDDHEGANNLDGERGTSPKPTPDYVEFLSNNGSILDLWKMINENEKLESS